MHKSFENLEVGSVCGRGSGLIFWADQANGGAKKKHTSFEVIVFDALVFYI